MSHFSKVWDMTDLLINSQTHNLLSNLSFLHLLYVNYL